MGSYGRRRRSDEDEFTAFYAARGDQLRGTAYLLCGDWHLAEDLTQITFIKLYRAWARVERHEVIDQYARRVLLRAFLDERRRPWRREHSTAPESATFERVAAQDPDTDRRLVLHAALLDLPKRRRAVLVLRFWLDLSVEQTAEILGCTAGTVKSQTSDGLADLRRALGGSLDVDVTLGGRT
ncbi:MAG: SigE family RNA polymerase sigma factor [Micromonosporaceae bacterium]|nr:SigE family RNA polymerase sigma factor [Micromonosporaceae bacterium]